MKRLLTIVLLTTAVWVQGSPVKVESVLRSQHEADAHLRVRRGESQFLATIEKLAGHKNYGDILYGAQIVEQKDLEKEKEDKADLNSDQLKAVFFYTMENQFVYALNKKLKENHGPGEFGDYVKLLLSALRKIGTSSPKEGILWRIVSGGHNHAKGEQITWPAFSSTSADRNSVPDREDTVTTLYKIENALGYCITCYSRFPNEKEFLLPPNTKLEVIDPVQPNGDRRLYTLRLIHLGSSGAMSIGMTVPRVTWITAFIVAYISVF